MNALKIIFKSMGAAKGCSENYGLAGLLCMIHLGSVDCWQWEFVIVSSELVEGVGLYSFSRVSG